MSRAEKLIRSAVRHSIRISGGNVEDVQLTARLKQILEAGLVLHAARRKMCRGMTNDGTLTFQIQHGLEELFRPLLVEKAGNLMIARRCVF